MGAVGALFIALWIMAAGVTQPGGGTTDIFIHDNAAAANGQYYTFAEIAAAFPAAFTDLGTFRKSYRAQATVQIGDATVDSAPTTLLDTNSDVYFDALKTLRWRATQTSSWRCKLGTRIGTGLVAGAKDGCTLAFGATTVPRGLVELYDSEFITQGTNVVSTVLGADDNGSEIVGCTFLGMGGGNVTLGTATQRFSNIFNVNIFGSGTIAIGSWGAVHADEIKVANASPVAFLRTPSSNVVIRNPLFIGTPTASDWSWSNVGATNWVLVRPTYSSMAPKFAQLAGGSMAVENGTKEVWIYKVKLVDENGDAVAGIPVKLTDVLGNVIVDAISDVNGRVSFVTTFPSGATEQNGVIVMDHYTVSQVYTQRHRGPFLEEINVGAGSSPNYFPKSKLFKWPGHETITLSSGTFEDVNSVIELDSIVHPSSREEWRPAYA